MNERECAAGLAPTPGYRYATIVGDQLFVAGQVPLDADGALVGASAPAEQTRQCLQNLEILLAVHGFLVDDIRRLMIYVVGDELDEVWGAICDWSTTSFDGEGVPPATLLGINRLGHPGQLVEIDVTVIREPSDPQR